MNSRALDDIVAFICVCAESNSSDLDCRARIDSSVYCKHLLNVSMFETIPFHRLLQGKIKEIFCRMDLLFNTLP